MQFILADLFALDIHLLHISQETALQTVLIEGDIHNHKNNLHSNKHSTLFKTDSTKSPPFLNTQPVTKILLISLTYAFDIEITRIFMDPDKFKGTGFKPSTKQNRLG